MQFLESGYYKPCRILDKFKFYLGISPASKKTRLRCDSRTTTCTNWTVFNHWLSMTYLIAVFIVIIWLSLSLSYYRDKNSKKLLNAIRDAWGKPKSEPFNFDRIGKYAVHKTDSSFHRLSQQTLLDIDFPELFEFADRTTSRIGQQYLFNILIHPENDPVTLQSREADIQFFLDTPEVREEIQIELSSLSNHDAYQLATLFRPTYLERPKWLKFTIINIFVPVACILLSVKFPVMLMILMLSLAVNILIHYWNKKNIYQYVLSFSQLNLTINACDRISRKASRFKNKSVTEGVADLRPFQAKLNLLDKTNDGGLKGDVTLIFTYFIELLKASLLIEVFTLFHLIEKLESKKEVIGHMFRYLGEIDTAISIASLRSGSQPTCRPEFIPSIKNIEAIGLYHPLIVHCTKNDIKIKGHGILVTGSNMSGKTTFLRTLILNSILAQTINTCFADEFKTPFLKQFSSIRIDDSLLDGKSYYFEEVNLMSTIVKEARSPEQNLFVLDEVFKGTNTIERIAAAKAILSYLNQGDNVVVVSTHDIALAGMLESEYDLYHFTEVIDNGELRFDHRLKAGPLKTRNAIRILELFNYPVEIVEEAKEVSRRLDNA